MLIDQSFFLTFFEYIFLSEKSAISLKCLSNILRQLLKKYYLVHSSGFWRIDLS